MGSPEPTPQTLVTLPPPLRLGLCLKCIIYGMYDQIKAPMQPLIPSIPTGTVLCNTDAAWNPSTKETWLGWIFTDRHTQVLHQGSIGQRNVPSAYMALIQASSYNYTDICLRTDSQELARAITMRRRSTELFGILSDIDSLVFSPSSPFRSCAVAFTPRARNGPADSLAKACLVSFLGLRP